ncbi:MAG: hypothetical protein JSU65_04060, partial [Candidatus Zixiibacteriota bacterium]
ERFGRDVIRDLWIKADTFGVGDNWLMAANAALLEATGGSDSLATAVQEFAVWNYFTGQYANWAPDDIGFSEKEKYPEIPIGEFAVHTSYPYFVSVQDNEYAPQVNAGSYVQFQNIQKILTDYWECDSVVYDTFFSDSLTIDSIDTICFDSTLVIDTNFTVFLSLRDGPYLSWGVSFIVQLEEEPDSSEVLSLPPVTDDVLLEIEGTHRFHSITMIVTPTSIDPGYFSPLGAEGLGHSVIDTSGSPSVAPVSAILTPYPNPAVVPLMGLGDAVDKGQNVWFRFDVPATMMGQSIYDECIYTVDVFAVSGELVRTVRAQASGEPMRGEEGLVIRFDIPWDMKNEANRDVASGVYLAYARLREAHNLSALYAEDRAKVAIIR